MKRAATWRRMRKAQPFTVSEWEAVIKLEADLAYRTPKGRPMAHVVLPRRLAVALLCRSLTPAEQAKVDDTKREIAADIARARELLRQTRQPPRRSFR